MTRQWTIEELDRVHPLRNGWTWDVAFGAPPVARHGKGIGSLAVYIDDDELISEKTLPEAGERFECMFGCKAANEGTAHEPPPADVAFAVLLASKGLDSREAMAAAMSKLAHRAEMKAERVGPCTEAEAEWATKQATWQEAAAMLWRGTVQP